MLFSRYIEECGVPCEHITPHMIAAPFYRGRFGALIIPTGFANPSYSCLLPALKASSSRIRRFISEGGHLLVFGAASEREDAYDWLPIRVRYHHEYGGRSLDVDTCHPCAALLEGYDTGTIECDGYFTDYEVHYSRVIVRESCHDCTSHRERGGCGHHGARISFKGISETILYSTGGNIILTGSVDCMRECR